MHAWSRHLGRVKLLSASMKRCSEALHSYLINALQRFTYLFNDNDNDKRLGLTAKADQPDHKKIQYTKNKTDNEAVQKLHTS